MPNLQQPGPLRQKNCSTMPKQYSASPSALLNTIIMTTEVPLPKLEDFHCQVLAIKEKKVCFINEKDGKVCPIST